MNSFDFGIVHFLNAFAQRSWIFDSLVTLMADNNLLEGGIIVPLFWWAWNERDKNDSEHHEYLLFGLFASVFAVFVARALALSLPFRERPMHNPLLDFRLPYSMDPNSAIGWSSFPSDHAVLFFCLAMSLWFVSKRLGAVALGYCVFGICLPRVYLGYHYPTDEIAGALIGIGIAYIGKLVWLRKGLLRPALYWQDHHPASFTAFLFLCSIEIAEEFDSLRAIGLRGYHGIEIILQALR